MTGKIVENPKIKEKLLKERFPLECENLPVEELTEEEEELVTKCILKEDFTSEEYADLSSLLARYRKAMDEYNPKDTINNYHEAIHRITTAQELIDVMDSKQKIFLKLPIRGKTYAMEFILEPISDSRALKGLALELNLFKNYSEKEKEIYARSQVGKTLTPEENKVVRKINREIEQTMENNQDEIMVEFLAHQLKLNDEDTYEKMVEFWSKFPINARVSMFVQVEELLGLTESKDFELFPVSE